MDKSLTPLIAFFALLILLSFVLINSNYLKKDFIKSEEQAMTPQMELRPDIETNPLASKFPRKKSENSQLIDIGKTFGKAKTLLANGKNREAEELLRTILVFDPRHIQTLSLLGGMLYYSNRYAEAELMFRRQIELNPHSALAYNRLGSTLAKQKKYKEAIDNSSIAVGINPDSGEGHINLAGMYSMIGKKDKAIEHFQKAYKLIGYAILPLSYDEAFTNIRTMPEFQTVLSKAKENLKEHGMKNEKKKNKAELSTINNSESKKKK
jgi:tetratricopeptide (TPR) repeat protein